MLNFLVADDKYSITGLILSLIGATFVILAFFPQVKYIYQTKNTVGLNMLMFSLHATVACLFLFSSLCKLTDTDMASCTIAQFICMLILNIVLFYGCLYMLQIKINNRVAAQDLSISELDHYNNHVVPALEAKKAKKQSTDKINNK